MCHVTGSSVLPHPPSRVADSDTVKGFLSNAYSFNLLRKICVNHHLLLEPWTERYAICKHDIPSSNDFDLEILLTLSSMSPRCCLLVTTAVTNLANQSSLFSVHHSALRIHRVRGSRQAASRPIIVVGLIAAGSSARLARARSGFAALGSVT